MHDILAVQMMQRCLERITSLQEQVARLAPKAEAYDRIGTLIDMQAGNHNRAFGGESDIAWNLRAEIEMATRRMSDEKSQTTTRADRPADYRDPDEQEKYNRAASAACQAEAVQREINRRHSTTQTLHDE
jgi:hypothetical protein